MTKRKFARKMQDQEFEATPQPRRSYSKGARKQVSNTSAADNVLNFRSYVQQRKTVSLIPKSINQEGYIEKLLDPEKLVIFATGPAGTGKTMLAVLAAIKAFKEGSIDKIVITRPAVEVDEEKHGFLPGDLNEKMAPWTRPIFDVMSEYYSPREIAVMLEEQVIEISPLAFLRGRTFKNSWIIADEMQNTSVNQMLMILTRIGDNSKMVITGDLGQNDRKFHTENGLADFLEKYKKYAGNIIETVEFTGRDVQRSAAVKEVLKLYGQI